jgi:hypothetical protein
MDHTFGIYELAEGYRAGQAASAERIKALEGLLRECAERIKALEGLLRECADALEAEVRGRSANDLPRRTERDMEPIIRARALFKEADQ